MTELRLGPLLRHVSPHDAVVWVETAEPCEVDVLERSARTFTIEGRHYAVVAIESLEPGTHLEYEVRLDGERAWPPAGSKFPPSAIRTPDPDRPLRMIFGSCRSEAPHEPPYTEDATGDSRGCGIDALRTYALRMKDREPASWPDVLAMLGDQIYADDLSPPLSDEVERRRDDGHPTGGGELRGFDDYAVAYGYAWSEPAIRWLLSTVPTAMIFDDHEIHDLWKVSASWIEDSRRQGWYEERIVSGLMTYWLYQHLGNLSPGELRDHELIEEIRASEDGVSVLRDFARTADIEPGHSRWSFSWDLGRAKLVVVDSRAGRELEPGERRMVSEGEWAWIEAEARAAGSRHLLLASSVPFLLSRGLHEVEAWNEAIGDGRWGPAAARLGERLRRAGNLGHWAAFRRSFLELEGLLEKMTSGRTDPTPGSVVMLSGDVHHCYLAEVGFRPEVAAEIPVWQAVCSGFRRQLDRRERVVMRLGNSGVGASVGRLLAAAAGLPPPGIGWRLVTDPCYENQIGTLDISEDRVDVRIEAPTGDWRDPDLCDVMERRLV